MSPDAEANSTPSNHHKLLRLLHFYLRLSALPLTVASMWVMAKNKQSNDTYGKLEFSNLTGFKYLVCVDAISSGYALASAGFTYLWCISSNWFFFVLDQVVVYLMITSGSAAAEVLYLAYEGARNASWSEACTSYASFCSRVKVSLALHFTGLLLYIVISLVSTYTFFAKFEPPPVPSNEVRGQHGQASN